MFRQHPDSSVGGPEPRGNAQILPSLVLCASSCPRGNSTLLEATDIMHTAGHCTPGMTDGKHVCFDDTDPTPRILALLHCHRGATDNLAEIKGTVPENHRQIANGRPLPPKGTWKLQRAQCLSTAEHLASPTVPTSLFHQQTAPDKSLVVRKVCVPHRPAASCLLGEKLFPLHISKQGNKVAKGHVRITHLSSRRAAQTPQHVYLLYVLQDTLWASFLRQWDHNSTQVTYLAPHCPYARERKPAGPQTR